MAKLNTESFEEALKQLEAIVKKMEAGDMPLEASLEAFEEGVKLTNFCARKLDEAQRRVELLLDKNGSQESVPWQETTAVEGEQR